MSDIMSENHLVKASQLISELLEQQKETVAWYNRAKYPRGTVVRIKDGIRNYFHPGEYAIIVGPSILQDSHPFVKKMLEGYDTDCPCYSVLLLTEIRNELYNEVAICPSDNVLENHLEWISDPMEDSLKIINIYYTDDTDEDDTDEDEDDEDIDDDEDEDEDWDEEFVPGPVIFQLEHSTKRHPKFVSPDDSFNSAEDTVNSAIYVLERMADERDSTN